MHISASFDSLFAYPYCIHECIFPKLFKCHMYLRSCVIIPNICILLQSNCKMDSRIFSYCVLNFKEKRDMKTLSVQEKLLLKPLIKLSLRSGKQPVKADVTLLQRSSTALASLPQVKIKHQIWAIVQAEKNKNKKIMKELKLLISSNSRVQSNIG